MVLECKMQDLDVNASPPQSSMITLIKFLLNAEKMLTEKKEKLDTRIKLHSICHRSSF